MKKICSFALILMSMLSCIIFSACGDKYADLNMEFFSKQGTKIDALELVIDPNNEGARKTQIGVKFSGIDEDDIGQIVVYSSPVELVTVSNYSYSNDMCYVDIKANMASENAKLIVSHLSSNKTASIDLKIQQKSTGLNLLNDKYIISIPQNEGESNEHYLDIQGLVNLSPAGSTDKVFFSYTGSDLSEIEPITDEETGFIRGFEVEYGATPQSITVYPVTTLEGFDDKKYTNKPITIQFAKTLSSLSLKSEDSNLPEKIDHKLNETIYLISNDNSKGVGNYCYNNFIVSVDNFKDYAKFYDIAVSSSSSEIVATIISNNQILIQANAYTENVETVTISCNPKDYVGDIQAVSAEIKVKAEVKSDSIEVKKANAVQEKNNIDIYDYYTSGNSLGALFNFKAVSNSGIAVYKDLSKIIIKIDPEILYSNKNIYSDKDFKTQSDNKKFAYGDSDKTLSSQKYLLEIYKFNDLLKFYYDSSSGMLTSEPFNDLTNIYIKYRESEDKDAKDTIGLGIRLETFNESQLAYLKNISSTVKELSFEKKVGVQSALIQAGEYNKATYTFHNDEKTNVETIYLDNTKGVDNEAVNQNLLNVHTLVGVKGEDEKINKSVELEVEVIPITTSSNNLKLKVGSIVYDEDKKIFDGETKFTFTYSHLDTEETKNYLFIGFSAQTEVGEYQIKFSQPDTGFEKIITAYVYQSLTAEDIQTNFAKSDTAFDNVSKIDEGEKEYVFTDYLADYIVASKQQIDLEVNVPDSVLSSNILTDYVYSFEIGEVEEDQSQYFSIQKHSDYTDGHIAVMNFKKGTYVEGNKYVTLTVTVKTKQYSNIITQAMEDAEAKISLTFFIYEKIESSNISINHSNSIRYMSYYLGVYNQDESKLKLEISMDDEVLWNYVQAQEQLKKYNIGDIDYTGEEEPNKYLTTWNTWDGNYISMMENGQTNDSLSLQFNKSSDDSSYARTINAVIRQFNEIFTLKCEVTVKKPIITEKVVLTSEVNFKTDGNEDKYAINLKQGETYKVEASNYSTEGIVSHPGIVIQVVTKTFNAKQEYVSINPNTNEITVNTVVAGMKLIIFAKDALSSQPTSDIVGYGTPSSFLLETDENKYKKAYLVIDLDLSDGSTRETSYQIYDGDDFWEINDSDESKTAYYSLMNNVNVSNTTYSESKRIENFTGTIFSYGDAVYTLYGISLDNSNPNLFINLGSSEDDESTLENVRFEVAYNYEYTGTLMEDIKLGLINVNNGTLTNVFVDISGGGIFKSTVNNYYFGGLVGENCGKIIFENNLSENYIGTNGKITLKGSGNLLFGGVVGKNLGSIDGFDVDNAEGDDISVGLQYVVANLAITAADLSASNSAIGQVAGLNTSEIKDIYTTGSIIGVNNLGGVIGKNEFESTSITVKLSSDAISAISEIEYKIQNIVSSVKVIGSGNNVGGVVGYDTNGTYKNVQYQILPIASGASGENNVGGIVGYSQNGKFKYCAVYSYVWDYSDLENTFEGEADISGSQYVGGLIGYADGSVDTLKDGDNDTSKKVVVSNSSVNAKIKAENNIGGLLTSSELKISVAYNVYFIGILNCDLIAYETVDASNKLCLDNQKMVKSNVAYTINVEDGALVSGSRGTDGNPFTIRFTNPLDYETETYWGWDADLNGAYIYVVKDGENNFFYKPYNYSYNSEKWDNDKGKLYIYDESSKDYINATEHVDSNRYYIKVYLPIFDIAPTKIDVTVNGEGVKNEEDEKINDLINLYYYDFNLSTTNNANLTELNAKYNTYNLTGENGLFSIAVEPQGITSRLSISSSNNRVVRVTNEAKLIVEGNGQCVLTFASILNPNVYDEIIVNVSAPIGDEDKFIVSESETDENEEVGTLKVAKDSSKQLFIISSGEKRYPDVDGGSYYSYATAQNVKLKVVVSIETTKLAGKTISDYISISGIAGEEIIVDANTILTVYLDETTPMSISVKQYLSDITNVFSISVMPYETISCVVSLRDESKKFESTKLNLLSISYEFSLLTAVGPTEISANITSAVIYPNDVNVLTILVKTDIELDDPSIITSSSKLTDSNGNILKDAAGNVITNNLTFVKFMSYENGIQKIQYKLEFDESIFGENGKLFLVAKFVLSNGEYAEVEYTLLKQRINKIEIKNYEIDGTELILSDILKPAKEDRTNGGRLIIDMAPNNGYYDYLEIRDITANEEIKFIQLNGALGSNLSALDEVTADGKGIKLVKVGNDLRTYVSTQISKDYSSKIHTIEVGAYLSDGTLLTSNVYYIDVKMLPSITVEYQLPDGNVGLTAENRSVSDYLAQGTYAQFRVTGSNYNSEIETSVTNLNYELVHDSGDFYLLQLKENETATLGETVKVTFKVYSVADSGDYEETEASITFTIVKFVIHSVSVVDANKDEIYGNTGTTKELEFYFSGTDVSFAGVDREESYRYGDEFWNDLTGLKTILENLNTSPDSYLKLNIGVDNDKKLITSVLEENWKLNAGKSNEIKYKLESNKLDKTEKTESGAEETKTIIQLNSNKLTVQEETNSIKKEITENSQTKVVTQPIYLAVDITLKLSDNVWSIASHDDTENLRQFTKNFRLNFNDATSLFKPKLVKDAEDFLAMNSGENNHYILGNDITLENYSPIDVDIASFDGNGRTITIESFASFDEEIINAGLFKKIYEGMLVKNVNIVFKSTYLQETGEYSFGQTDNGILFADICNNSSVNYTEAIFGGLTPLNEGIVTNCMVSGTIALHASTIESKKTSTGGNYSINFTIGGLIGENTGYVTHSGSSLNIYAQANIGGFVYRNEGHISSCEHNNGDIYTYNNNLDKTIVVKIAGFVVENAGKISMSDVELMSKTMSAKDVSAGFVYENSGEIEDCYVNILKTGTNNNTFCGFVYQNSGTISTSYTCINNGNKENNNDYMFAPTSSTGIYNCIEINNSGENSGYSSGVEGLKSLIGSKRTVRSEYEKYGFTFGDNKTAIWIISSGLPKLVSVQDKVRYTLDEDPIGDSVYYGLQNVYKQAVEGEENSYEYITNPGNYGSKSNPYVIYDLITWNYYFEDNTNKYFRIVADIDFGSIGDNPLTSTRTFKGNIQGNNMKLTNILLKSSSSLNSIGLFKEFVSANNVGIENSVRNLTLSISSVWATKTSLVGVLVGISENFNLYNIHIDSAGKTIVGGNAVGGVAGVVRGKFNMQKISSNVGVNSTVATDRYKYAIYISKNNKRYEDASLNLKDVYYAGSVAGILDAHDSSVYDFEAERDISIGYFEVKDITVSGSIVAIGDSVGGAFGFVGERVKLQNVSVDLTDSLLSGGQYSAGIAGENRGVIDGATITIEGDSTFNDSTYVSAGIVGLNLGGLVQNVNAKCNILKSGRQTVVAGIVGRNMNGNVNNATFTGQLSAGFVGGIIGGDYSNRTVFKGSPSGSGALSGSYLDDAIPENQIVYSGIMNYENLTISKQTLDHFFENIKKYYTFKTATTFESAINRYYIYGLCDGVSDNEDKVIVRTYGLDDDKNLVFNGSETHAGDDTLTVKVENSLLVSATSEDIANEDIKTFDFSGNVIKGYPITESFGTDILVAYTVGAFVSTFDTWDRTAYGNDMIIFTNS